MIQSFAVWIEGKSMWLTQSETKAVQLAKRLAYGNRRVYVEAFDGPSPGKIIWSSEAMND